MELYTEILCRGLAAVFILNIENQKFSNSWGKWEQSHFTEIQLLLGRRNKKLFTVSAE